VYPFCIESLLIEAHGITSKEHCMIDPSLQSKVAQVARNLSNQQGRVDLKYLWKLLSNIDPLDFHRKYQAAKSDYSYGALPVTENPGTSSVSVANGGPVAGIDGSQVYPSPLHPVRWAYIQALAYSPLFPIRSATDFLNLEASELSDGDLDERQGDKTSVDFSRTLLELRVALEVVDDHPDHTILMDYPLLPWIPKSDRCYNKRIHQYVGMIDNLKGKQIAGIVSAPKSQLLINLISLSEKLEGRQSNLPKVSDTFLVGANLQPGQRSAIFNYAGSRNEIFRSQGIEIYFFFILINRGEVVRVEIPDWIAQDPSCIDLIHSSILKDSLALGYSYALAKAHQEVAIPLDIADSLHSLATREYISAGGTVYGSAKNRAKGLY
jgi:hypothetical protein